MRKAQNLCRQPATEFACLPDDEVRLPVAGNVEQVREGQLGQIARKRPSHHERQEVLVWAGAELFPAVPQSPVANGPVKPHREGSHSARLEMWTEAGGAGASDLMPSGSQSLGDRQPGVQVSIARLGR